MTAQDLIKYWHSSANEDLQVASELFDSKRYHHCLFFCHLALEKLLKGLIYKNTENPPMPIHNLTKLAQQASLSLSQDQKEKLEEITTWNVQARYDSVKQDFYNKATLEFTTKWMSIVKEIFLWLENQY